MGIRLDLDKQLAMHERNENGTRAEPSVSAANDDILCPGTPDEPNCGSPLSCLDAIMEGYQNGLLFNSDADSASDLDELDSLYSRKAKKSFQVKFDCLP